MALFKEAAKVALKAPYSNTISTLFLLPLYNLLIISTKIAQKKIAYLIRSVKTYRLSLISLTQLYEHTESALG